MNKPLTRAEWLEWLDTTWKKCLHEAWDKEWNEMTKDDDDTMCYRSEVEAAVRAEREACANLLEANAMACENPIYRSLLQANADEIRARGNT